MFLMASFALLLTACQGTIPGDGGETIAHAWVTTADGGKRMEPLAATWMASPDPAGVRITIDPADRYQTMIGMGAAFTDASADLIQNRLSDVARAELLEELFSPETGLGFSFTRVVIGASDFSSVHYSLDDTPGNRPDPDLSHYTFEPMMRAVVPVVLQARSYNPALVVMATPWSPPAWMKTSQSLIKGTLREDAYSPFADYLVRTIQSFEAAGVPIEYVSLQNEPDFEPVDYPGMRLSAAQRALLISDFVGPALEEARLQTKILDWDHNWDQPGQPLEVLENENAERYVAGVAWHCYGGDVAAQSAVRDAFPEKEVLFTECSGGEWSAEWPDAWTWTMDKLVIGAPSNWARGVLMWNIALDENHGPHLGGCSDCRGIVTIDSRTGEIERNQEYYALGHFSRFVRAGATRIGSVSSMGSIRSVGFQNSDGSIVVIALNTSELPETISVGADASWFAIALDGGAGMTMVLP
ncbi:MAG TPA: glycosyl hydrolase [Hyphomonas sp.]|nr:glycosyl hydrolase [Hyphomonas sp.]